MKPTRMFGPFVLLAAVMLSGVQARAAELPDFVTLAKKFGPAVVNISTKQKRGNAGSGRGFEMPDIPENSPLRDFFRHFLGEGEGGEAPERESRPLSLGSGFFISADGYLLTNHHVVDEADEIIVRTSDHRQFDAKVVGSDRRSDTALLKIDIENAPVMKVGTARELEVGEWVLAIGSPFGFDHSVTAGIVSAKGRSLPSENYVPFIQTDVAINPGNSGGPLIDLAGNVVGVNSQIYSRTGGFMGLSFAVPIDLAMDVAEQLRTKGHVSRGWLGVMIQDVTRELAESFGMPHPTGALVSQVLPESPAEAAGMRVGDVILTFDGHKVHSSSALPPLVGTSPVERASTLKILRNGREREIEVVIGELPDEEAIKAELSAAPKQQPSGKLGLTVEDLTPAQREEMGLSGEGGVLVLQVDAGPAREAGIQRGDVLLMVDNQSISDAGKFSEVVGSLPAGRSVAVLVQRDGGRMFTALRMPK